jgi:nicotinate-nucleotide adenylyltransferase
MYDIPLIKKRVRSKLSGFRYKHTLAIASYAKKLAALYGLNPESAYVAGLLHDYAKELDDKKIVLLTKKHPYFTKYPNVRTLHGIAGAELAKKEFGITDKAILDAISQHVIPKKRCATLTMILYIADKTDKNKGKYLNVVNIPYFKRLASKNLKKAFRELYKITQR